MLPSLSCKSLLCTTAKNSSWFSFFSVLLGLTVFSLQDSSWTLKVFLRKKGLVVYQQQPQQVEQPPAGRPPYSETSGTTSRMTIVSGKWDLPIQSLPDYQDYQKRRLWCIETLDTTTVWRLRWRIETDLIRDRLYPCILPWILHIHSPISLRKIQMDYETMPMDSILGNVIIVKGYSQDCMYL